MTNSSWSSYNYYYKVRSFWPFPSSPLSPFMSGTVCPLLMWYKKLYTLCPAASANEMKNEWWAEERWCCTPHIVPSDSTSTLSSLRVSTVGHFFLSPHYSSALLPHIILYYSSNQFASHLSTPLRLYVLCTPSFFLFPFFFLLSSEARRSLLRFPGNWASRWELQPGS